MLDAADRLEAIDELLLKSLRALRVVSGREQIDRGRQHALRREAGIRIADGLKTLDEQPGADQQHKAQGHLDQHETRPHPGASARSDNPTGLRSQRTREVDVARHNGRHQPEEKRRHHTDAGAQPEYPPIKRARQPQQDATARRRQQRQRVAQPVGHDESARGSEHRQDQPLSQQLLHQTSSSGADG